MAPPSPPDPGGPHAAIKRELLVRLLDGWLPGALHGNGRATYLDAYPTDESVSAALRVTTEFPDLLDRHRLDVVLIDLHGDPRFTARIAAIQRRLAPPNGVSVQIVPADSVGRLTPLKLPASGPLLGYLDAAGAPAPDPAELAYLVSGARTQALLALDASAIAAGGPEGLGGGPEGLGDGTHRSGDGAEGAGDGPHGSGDGAEAAGQTVAGYRRAMAGAGAGQVACVELVAVDGRAELLLFRSAAARSLEAFKAALWAVDEYAGVRYRDPRDPEHALLDISLTPHPGPLRRALLSHLADTGARSVADLRRYALAETVYRAADVMPVLAAMVSAGTVRREPAKGRLSADALISLP